MSQLKELNISSRLRQMARSSILAPHIDGFVQNVSSVGYTETSLRDVVVGAIHFGAFLTSRGLPEARRIEQKDLQAFFATQPLQACRGYRYRFSRGIRGARHMLRYLRSRGVAEPERPPPQPPYAPLLGEWLSHLESHRGLAAATVQHYRRHIVRFLESLGQEATREGMARLGPDPVRRHLEESTHQASLSQCKGVSSTLRIFLRFAWRRGWTRLNLSLLVLSPPSFRQQALPKGPRWEDVVKLPPAVDRSSARGRRNYAILPALITYSVRAGQLCALRLEDVDWRGSSLRFPAAKQGKSIKIPLIEPVGGALVDYLRRGRPASASRELFLSSRPPFAGLTNSAIYGVVSGAFRQAGVESPHLGSHAIRHAWAARMINEGRPLKTIADLLGHRSLETTRLYAKLDFVRLREVGLPWPKEEA